MILYAVSSNYNNGIREEVVDSINNDGTFTYTKSKRMFEDWVITRPMVPEYGNGTYYFTTHKEAKEHLIERLNDKIAHFSFEIDKCKQIIDVL